MAVVGVVGSRGFPEAGSRDGPPPPCTLPAVVVGKSSNMGPGARVAEALGLGAGLAQPCNGGGSAFGCLEGVGHWSPPSPLLLPQVLLLPAPGPPAAAGMMAVAAWNYLFSCDYSVLFLSHYKRQILLQVFNILHHFSNLIE